ncbi:heparan-alpha-glucosaminide N-acetyltransferase domain-containing protein [Croceitalea rosinachiae]|uniref:Heparan-alpha-glucosaminide N-acetyltransferase domain-containing protein n=1 Tax=Croceitalea rosinachiae TaxID=3075596 RepID=A0ABU3ACP2_9FLAO|nr:heparan-alpha-glucosaminide N-acetyltransferase domain-containing protein [Croceitalea sp. F388]MDT0607754.1 heparan-alpha-glucosaminide N-acetyltransferase domain-containing protein [Croceitalea sp. F388]
MKPSSTRLFFIDAMRAWAILMMLQGHFIDGLLDTVFRNPENMVYTTWLYFRGITAPVFFTVSGFIFTYLLVRDPERGLTNPRVKKGIRRGLQLLLIGYLLRLNLFGLFSGKIYDSFYLVDVLHCIGISILAIVGIYVFTASRKKWLFPSLLISFTLLLFLFEPLYKQWSFGFLPTAIANYFTKMNGSVFTIIPWLGYTSMGAFLSILFTRFKEFKYLYPTAITIALVSGLSLIFFSSDLFVFLFDTTRITLFKLIELNNYLFIRLGDVFVVFAIFMLMRGIMSNKTILKIGASTLSIYVIHFVILYGSFTGLGLYSFFNHQLSPSIIIPGALVFMFVCTYLALQYGKYEVVLKKQFSFAFIYLKYQVLTFQKNVDPILREVFSRVRLFINRILGIVRN